MSAKATAVAAMEAVTAEEMAEATAAEMAAEMVAATAAEMAAAPVVGPAAVLVVVVPVLVVPVLVVPVPVLVVPVLVLPAVALGLLAVPVLPVAVLAAVPVLVLPAVALVAVPVPAVARRGRQQTARLRSAGSLQARPALALPQARRLEAMEMGRPMAGRGSRADLATGRGRASWPPRPRSGRGFTLTNYSRFISGETPSKAQQTA
jgi:hypothetical protein